jgi:tRNA(Ile)-lysidine synthase
MINNVFNKVKAYADKNNMFCNGETVVVAVSGGPDSLCLLEMLKLFSDSLQLKLVVAHLDHCLRPEGRDEAAGIAALAQSLSLPFELSTVDIKAYKEELGVGEEEAGRHARYNLLFEAARKHGAEKIATGHHRDDLAETVLLNVLRGSSVDGMAGILPISTRHGFKLIRPLLCLWRSEIEAYCNERGLKPYTDSSNLETDYKRNKVRLELIPHIEEVYNPRVRESLARLAEMAARDRWFLGRLARLKYKKLAQFCGKETVFKVQDLNSMPSALLGRVIFLALKKYLPAGKIAAVHIDQLTALAKNNKTGLTVTLPGDLIAHISYNKMIIMPGRYSSAALTELLELPVPGKVNLPGGFVITACLSSPDDISWPPPSYRACLDYEQLPSALLTVRTRKPGDRFFPQGAPGGKKLKDFMIDQKIPRQIRDTLPLVVAGKEVIWPATTRIAEPYKVTDKTKEVLVLEYKMRRLKTTGKDVGKNG